MDCSPPGSSVHGIHQARVLEWVATHSLLQAIFPTQGPDPSLLCLLHWQVHSLPLAPPGKPFPPRIGHYFSLFLRAEHRLGPYKPAVWVGLTDYQVCGSYQDWCLFRPTILWVPNVKTRWDFSLCLVLYSESLVFWPVRIFCLVFPILSRVPLGGQFNRLGFQSRNSQAAMLVFRELCHKGSQSIRGPCHLHPCCFWLVLEKSHSSSACLVSQISESVMEGFHVPHCHNTILTTCVTKAFAFLGYLRVNFLYLVRVVSLFQSFVEVSCILG